jgi:hypothetical protein
MSEQQFIYSNQELTEQVNRIPNTYGLLNDINLFPSESISTRVVEIRFEDGIISVLEAKPVASPGQTIEDVPGKSIFLEIPYFPVIDNILPSDVQGFNDIINGRKELRNLDTEIVKKLRKIRGSHGITREFIRLGALKGHIRDGKGRTLHNLFNAFGVTKKVISFGLGVATTDIIEKCQELATHMAENLKGETMTRAEVVVSGSFFNKFTQHAKVEKFWLNSQNALQLANTQRDGAARYFGRQFEFQNVLFREYVGQMPVRNASGQLISEPIIEAGKGHAYPAGTSDTFKTYDGPVHHMDRVNEPGEEIFISTEMLKHGEGVEMKSQSSPLAVVRRPELLVEVSE